ncbi:hypothetical protein ACQSSU_03110 [Micromonospora echinospora]
MSRPTLIRLADILSATADLTPCPDCAGGLGLHVDPADVDVPWEAVVVHSVPCPHSGVTAADYQAACPHDDQAPTGTDPTGDLVAILAALHRGDDQGAAEVLATVDPAALIGPLIATVAQLGPAAVGPDAWIETLTAWQPGQAIGDGLA